MEATPAPAVCITPHDQKEPEVILVQFGKGDLHNPMNFSSLRKWAIVLTGCVYAGIASAASASYTISIPSMMAELHCTDFQASLGLGLYALGFGIAPLICSSFSEEVGRRPVYIVASILFMLFQVMNALAPNIQVVLVSRALQGFFSSTGASLVGGSIADIFQPHERGFPMSLFAFSTIFSFGLGSAIGGLIAANPALLGWRWVQWVHVMFSGALIIMILLVMSETRSSIILARIASATRKSTGDKRYQSSAQIDNPGMLYLFKTSCTRPLHILFTEPIVRSFSLWSGFIWGVVYCLIDSITAQFQSVYGFSLSQAGLVSLALSFGAIIGFFANMYQEVLYRKYVAKKGQEARLYMTCVAGLILPASMFLYAWTASPNISWVVPAIGLAAFMSGVMVIYQVAFLYIADCYGPFASSAQAGQSLTRNLMAFAFPLFTQQMFNGMTARWAVTLFAILSVLMAPTPWVLFFYGAKIRSRSKVSRMILQAEMVQSSATLVAVSTQEKSMEV